MNSAEDRQAVANPEGRAALRRRLVAAREALPEDQHAAASLRIRAHLIAVLERSEPRIVGFCWPYRREFDCRDLVAGWLAADSARNAALPVILAPAAPMIFRRWIPGSPLVRGRYGIPVPEEDRPLVPDLVLMPLVGFDHRGYRLGYGGGYFDRTLAALDPRPVAVGVGFELARLPCLDPDPHDIPMDLVVTEAGVCPPTGR